MLAAFAFSVGSAAGAQVILNEVTPRHVEVPGTGASFVVPNDFSLAKQFDGFAANGRTINVIVAVIKSPFQGVVDTFTDSALEERGIKVHSRGEMSINGSRALFIKALHSDGGNAWGKWIMLLENGGDTLVVNGVFVSGDVNAATDVIDVLKSVAMKKKAPDEVSADTGAPAVSGDPRLEQAVGMSDDSFEPQRIISVSAEPTIIVEPAIITEEDETPDVQTGEPSALSEDLPVVSLDITEEIGAEEGAVSSDLAAPPISEDVPEIPDEGAIAGSGDIQR
jgi:hypothetical protein